MCASACSQRPCDLYDALSTYPTVGLSRTPRTSASSLSWFFMPCLGIHLHLFLNSVYGDAVHVHVHLTPTQRSMVAWANLNKMYSCMSPTQVYSWGWNDRGTLGHGHRAHERKPRRIQALTGKKIVQVRLMWDAPCQYLTDAGFFARY